MEITVVKNSITRDELAKIASEGFGDMVKVVVDVKQNIMAVGGELHADEEAFLMEQYDSRYEHLWGINCYPKQYGEEWIEFDSMINIKPSLGNRSRGVDNSEMQKKIREIVHTLVLA